MVRGNRAGWVGCARRSGGAVIAGMLAAGLCCAEQQRAIGAGEVSAVSPAIAVVLQQMSQSAGVIFAGQVISVERAAGDGAAGGGIVTVEFRVDAAVRGCMSGSVYTLKEWGGLWAASGHRYRVGQRLLLFLHSPGPSGLSSPVHGAEGRMPLRGGGVAPGPYDVGAGAGELVADLRWVQAQAVRSGVENFGNGVSHPVVGGVRGPKSEREPGGTVVPIEGGIASPLLERGMAVTEKAESAYLPLGQLLELCRGWMEAARVGW